MRPLPASRRRADTAQIARRRALDLIDGDEQLVVVHSARFGGATTLLGAWCAEAAVTSPVIGRVLDPAPETSELGYWRHLLESLCGPNSAPPGLSADAASAFSAVLEAVAGQETGCVLALDDLHLVEDPVSRVDDLFAHAPDGGLQILATTRSAGQWPNRLARTPGQKFVPPEAIRFTPDDVAELLRRAGLDFDARAPKIIHRLTAGLASLVHAVCISVPLAELADPAHLEEHVHAAVDREIDRTISTDPLLRDHRSPLLLSAAAAPLDAHSAEPLPSGCDDPRDFLNVLDRSGLACASGSITSPEWLYPEAVRESVLRLAAREAPDALTRYRRDLIGTWLGLDRPDRALSVAGDLEDWPRAVEILRDHLATLYSRGYPTVMAEEVLARVPDVYLDGDPVLGQLRSVHRNFSAPKDTPAPQNRAAPREPDNPEMTGMQSLQEPPEDLDYDARVEILFRAVDLRVQGEFAASARLCDRVAAGPPADLESMSDADRDGLGFAMIHIGISFIMVGRFTDATMALRRALRTAVEPFIHRDAAGKLALVNAVLGNTSEARTHLAEERRHPPLPTASEELVRPAGDVACVLIALDDLDTDTAMRVLGDLGVPGEREEFWGFILYACGLLSLVNNTPALGLGLLDAQLPRFATMAGNGAVVVPLLDALRADLLLACGRVGVAAEAVAGSTHPLTSAARARVLLLSDDPGGALALARAALTDPSTTTGDALGLQLVAAAASLATGDRTGARHYGAGASAVHQMTGLRRPFRSLPGFVMRRLADLAPGLPVDPHAPGPDYGTLTFREPGSVAGPATGHRPEQAEARQRETRLPARLTVRELAVLRELATGASINQVAARGFVSPNTVKSQVRAVYRKLGVSTRSEAVAAAQRLRLL